MSDPFDPQGLFSQPPPPVGTQQVKPNYNIDLSGLSQAPSIPPTATTSNWANFDAPFNPPVVPHTGEVVSPPGKPMPSRSSLLGTNTVGSAPLRAPVVPTANTSPSSLPVTIATPLTSGDCSSGSDGEGSASLFSRAGRQLQSGFNLLEKGQFSAALQEVNHSLESLAATGQVKTYSDKVQVCASYKLALVLLLAIKGAESNVGQSAFFTRILAEVNLRRDHRLVCVRMAINKNLEAKNYRVAARLIKTVLGVQIKDGTAMEEKLKLCQQNGLKNNAQFPYLCPCCATSVDCGDLQCSNCNTKVQFCAKTFLPITHNSFLQCTLCDTVFSEHSVSSSKCPFCSCGSLATCSIPTLSIGQGTTVSTEPSHAQKIVLPSPPESTNSKRKSIPIPPQKPNQLESKQETQSGKQSTTPIPPSKPSQLDQKPAVPILPQKPGYTDQKVVAPTLPQKLQQAPGNTSGASTKQPPQLPKKPASENDPFAKFIQPQETLQSQSIEPFEPKPESATKQPEKPMDLRPPLPQKPTIEQNAKQLQKRPLPTAKPRAASNDKSRTLPLPRSKNPISGEMRQKYLDDFRAADVNGDGFIDGKEAKIFFSNTECPKPKLALIWKLADVGQDGKLDIEEFIIAMYFVDAALRGESLPGVLPKEFLAPVADRIVDSKEYDADIRNRASSLPVSQPRPPPILPPKDHVDVTKPLPVLPPKFLKQSTKDMKSSEIPQHGKEKKNKKSKEEKKKKEKKGKKSSLQEPESSGSEAERNPTTFSSPPAQPHLDSFPAKGIPENKLAPPTLFTPPTLVTPPMLSNTLPSTTSLPKPSSLGIALPPKNNQSKPDSPRGRSESLPPLPPAKSAFPPLPPRDEGPPLVVPPTAPLSRQHSRSELVPWERFIPVQQSQSSAQELTDLPPDVAFGVQSALRLVKEGNVDECHSQFSDALKKVVSKEQLRQSTSAFNRAALWCCTCSSFQQTNHTILFIPLYFKDDQHYQIKMWVHNEEIAGIEFGHLSEDKWAGEPGNQTEWLIDQPKVVKCIDGTRKLIRSPKEEKEAILDVKVPLGIQVGPVKQYKTTLEQQFQSKEKHPSILRKDKSGKKYYVFCERNTSEATTKVQPDGYYREYWIPQKEEPSFCFILNRIGEPITEEPYVELVGGELEPLSDHKKKRKDKQLLKHTAPDIESFYIVTPIPPETISQSIRLKSVHGRPTGYISSDGKSFIQSFAQGEKKRSVGVEWEISLRSASLRPMYEGETTVKSLDLPSTEELKLSLLPTSELNFKEKQFEVWIGKVSLLRGIFGTKETATQFAHRVHVEIAKSFQFGVPSNFEAVSEIIGQCRGDSVALNKVFVAVLRANDVAARVIYGRWAKSQKKGETISWIGGDSGIESDQTHAISEFFLEGVGWVPTDPSLDVKNLNSQWDEDRPSTLDTHFGVCDGCFMAMAEDRTLLDTPVFGPRRDLNLQGPTLLFEHKKVTSTWNVDLS